MCEWLLRPRIDQHAYDCEHSHVLENGCKCCFDNGHVGGAGMRTALHLQADEDGNTPSVMARAEGHCELASMLELYEEGTVTVRV